MQKVLTTLGLFLLASVMCGCSSENVHNTAPRTDEDNAYIQQMDDQVAEEEQNSGN